MSELLSDNEVEALINEIGDEGPDSRIISESYELYDITSGMHRVKGWTQDVKIVDERIQTNLRIKLLGMLQKSVVIKRKEIHISKFSSYAKSLDVPASINVYSITGMVGYSALVISADLVHSLVNIFFGGGSRPIKIEGRDFTDTETRVVKLILATIIETIKTSWKELADSDFTEVETDVNPAHLSTYGENDVLMIRPFTVTLSGGTGGEIHLVMPGGVIDAIFRNKKSKIQSGEISAKEVISGRALGFEVDITGELTGAKLTIGEIFKLKLGDIITVDSPEELDLKVNGIAKRKAKMGDINGRVGLKVLS